MKIPNGNSFPFVLCFSSNHSFERNETKQNGTKQSRKKHLIKI